MVRTYVRAMFVVTVLIGGARVARADVDVNGAWLGTVHAPLAEGVQCHLTLVQVGTSLSGSGPCGGFGAATLSGTINPVTGAFSGTGSIGSLCPSLAFSAPSATDASFVANFSCTGVFPVSGTIDGTRCGNFVVDVGEVCDPSVDGYACCSPSCQPYEAGADCVNDPTQILCIQGACDGAGQCVISNRTGRCDDGNVCTGNDQCDSGTCAGDPLVGARCDLDSDACTEDACDATGACVADGCSACCDGPGCTPEPEPLCIGPVAPKAQLKAKSGKLVWRLKNGDTTSLAQLGDPTATTDYTMCIFNGADQLVLSSAAPAGGSCGGRPCWKTLPGKGVKYRSRSGMPDGIEGMLLKAGASGATKVDVKARYERTGSIIPLPLRVQVENADGECWEAVHSQGTFISFGFGIGFIKDVEGSPSGAFLH